VGKLTILSHLTGGPRAVAARGREVKDSGDYTVATRLPCPDGTEVPAVVTSITVQRADLLRFRIVTVLPAAGLAGPVAAGRSTARSRCCAL
jgi:hypothetical protein